MSEKSCKNFKRVVYTIPSTREAIKKLSETVMDNLKRHWPEMHLSKIALVLSEAFSNALFYGNFRIPLELSSPAEHDAFWQMAAQRENDETFTAREISLCVECCENGLTFAVKDCGNGFNWKTLSESMNNSKTKIGINKATLNYRPKGISIIRHYADELSWNKEGNEIRVFFKFRKS